MKKEMFFSILIGAVTLGAFCAEGDGIFSYSVGQYEVFMLVEGEREGNTAIIPSADAALLDQYIPSTGFRHTTNAFLVKTPEHNILIDAGTGAGDVLLSKIRQIGLEPEQIETVLITHLHADHFGGLQKDGTAVFPNTKVYISAKEYEHFSINAINERAVAVLALYGSNVITFESANIDSTLTEILPGISPIANYGHTPGHTVFLIENNEDKLIIAGDFLHVSLVQFAHPEISATFDMDQAAAATSRRQLLEYTVRNQIPIGGMHIVYPGIGTVEAEDTGFKFIPVR